MSFSRSIQWHHTQGVKGHGNEADFLGFWQKLVPHRSLTLPFEPFRFWLRIRGESGSRWLSDSASRRVDNSPTRQVGESVFESVKENLASRGVGDFPTRRVFRLRISPRIRSQNRNGLKCTEKELCRAKTPENPPRCHVPLRLNTK